MNHEEFADLVAAKVLAALAAGKARKPTPVDQLQDKVRELVPADGHTTIRELTSSLGLPPKLEHTRRIGRCLRAIGAVEGRRWVDGESIKVWSMPRPNDIL